MIGILKVASFARFTARVIPVYGAVWC
jgi:hypothetical protein